MASIGAALLIKMLDENRMREFSKLDKTWFVGSEQQSYDFIEQFLNQYGKLPSVEVFLKKIDVGALPAPEPYGYFCDEFEDRLIYNLVNESIPQIDKLIKTRKSKDLLTVFETVVAKAKSHQAMTSRDILQLSEIGESVISNIKEARLKGGITGVPTGWRTLDEATNGLQGGDVVLVLARPKKGKSLILIKMADAAYMTGHPPLVVSMEMTADQMGERIFALRTSLNMKELRKGHISTFAEQRLQAQVDLSKTGLPYLFVDGQFKKDVNEIKALVHSYRPAALYIDGGYLMKLKGTERMAKWERMAEIIEIIKHIAMINKIPAVVSFQFTRSVSQKAKTVGVSAFDNVQLSDAISQIATTGLAILDDEEGIEDTKLIEIFGGRNDEKGRFRIQWNWEQMKFDEIRDDEPPSFGEVGALEADDILVW